MLKSAFLTLLSCQATQAINPPTNVYPALVNEWLFMDETGLSYPWLTQPFLKELTSWDIKNWDVFEYGAGYSTGWFARHCHSVTSVDHSSDWGQAVVDYLHRLGQSNFKIKIHPMTEPDDCAGTPVALNPYVLAISEDQRKYDLIVIDGVYRNTCAEIALNYLKPGGVIVLDNADQRSIGLNSTSTFKKFAHLKHFSFAQPNHQDWKTDYWKE